MQEAPSTTPLPSGSKAETPGGSGARFGDPEGGSTFGRWLWGRWRRWRSITAGTLGTPGLAAAAVAVIVYAATLGHASAYDDSYILRSPLLHHPWNLREVFSNGFYARPDRTLGLYRPLGDWSLVLNALLAKVLTGGFDGWAVFHAVNVLLHAAASFLVFLWLARLPISRWVAGAAAILWAAHPVHAEVAANVTARYESLAAIFGLAFLIAHRARRAWLSAPLFLAALWCKESAIAFLPLALCVDALFPVDGRRFEVRAWIAPCALLVLWFGLRAAVISGDDTSTPYVENPVAPASPAVRAMTAAKVQILYLRDQLLPLWLSTDHSFRQLMPVRTLVDPFVLGFAVLLVLSAFLAGRLRTRCPELALGVIGYAILFSVTSNFVLPIGTIMADRLAYAPSIFTCLLAALGLARLRPRAAGAVAVGALVLLLSYQSYAQAGVWKDDLTLFREQVRTAPESAKSHGNLGEALLARDEMSEAVAEYKKSLEIYPYRPAPFLGLGQAYERLREDPELLINTWANSIRFEKLDERPSLQDALSAVDLGDWVGLAKIRSEMVRADPDDWFIIRVDRILRAAQLLSNVQRDGADWARGNALFRLRDFAEAEVKYRRALHHRDVPGSEIANTLLKMAVCNEKQNHPVRAAHLRKLAAEWSARPR